MDYALIDVKHAILGNPDFVQRAIQSGFSPKAIESETGNTPLHWAAASNHEEICKTLLEAGADPNAANRQGITPLAIATTHNRESVVRMMLEWGADPNQADRKGNSPLTIAEDNWLLRISDLFHAQEETQAKGIGI